MIRLKSSIRKNGFDYNRITRTEKRAVNSQHYGNRLIAYEVFKIFIRGARYSDIIRKDIPPIERFPSNESFGYTARTYSDLESAMEKYIDLRP